MSNEKNFPFTFTWVGYTNRKILFSATVERTGNFFSGLIEIHLNTILKPSASLSAVVALEKNGLHTTLPFSFAQKQTTKPKRKGKRLFGVSFLVVI